LWSYHDIKINFFLSSSVDSNVPQAGERLCWRLLAVRVRPYLI